MGPVGHPEMSIVNYQPMCVMPQKGEGLKYVAAEAWDLSSVGTFAWQPSAFHGQAVAVFCYQIFLFALSSQALNCILR